MPPGEAHAGSRRTGPGEAKHAAHHAIRISQHRQHNRTATQSPEGPTLRAFFSSLGRSSLPVLCLGHLCPCQTVRAPRLRRCPGGPFQSVNPLLRSRFRFLSSRPPSGCAPVALSPSSPRRHRLRAPADALPVTTSPAWPVLVPISRLCPCFSFLSCLPCLSSHRLANSLPIVARPRLHICRAGSNYTTYILLFSNAASAGRRQPGRQRERQRQREPEEEMATGTGNGKRGNLLTELATQNRK